jgi:hypothetical protein
MEYVAVIVNRNSSVNDIRFRAFTVEASTLQLAKKKAEKATLGNPYYIDITMDVMNRKEFIKNLLVLNTWGSGFSDLKWRLKKSFPSLFEGTRGTYIKNDTIPKEKMAMMETEVSRALPKLPKKLL